MSPVVRPQRLHHQPRASLFIGASAPVSARGLAASDGSSGTVASSLRRAFGYRSGGDWPFPRVPIFV